MTYMFDNQQYVAIAAGQELSRLESSSQRRDWDGRKSGRSASSI